MTFWGELTDGTELLLGEPMEAQLLYDSDAPASQLRAVFPAEKLWEDLAVVRVFHQGQVAFGGIVDEQNTALSGEGFTVELIARSWEALLLDNEARPAVLRSPSLGLLWERYFQPLGLTSVVGDQSPKAGELAVEKGTSCWELLESFCRDYLGTAQRRRAPISNPLPRPLYDDFAGKLWPLMTTSPVFFSRISAPPAE